MGIPSNGSDKTFVIVEGKKWVRHFKIKWSL